MRKIDKISFCKLFQRLANLIPGAGGLVDFSIEIRSSISAIAASKSYFLSFIVFSLYEQ